MFLQQKHTHAHNKQNERGLSCCDIFDTVGVRSFVEYSLVVDT